LTVQGDPVVLQVLAASSDDSEIEDSIDLIGTKTLALPAGDYRLRVEGKGRLGRTFRFAVNRGESWRTRFQSMRAGCSASVRLISFRTAPEISIRFAPVTRALPLSPGKFD